MHKYLFSFLGLLLGLVLLAIFSLPDRNLHVIFCDVGQGDAILISRGTTQLLVDGGPPNGLVSQCLNRHMPFWDRKIEVVLVTHPQEDHFGGVVDVVRRYSVDVFTHPDVEGTAEGWKVLSTELKNRKIDQKTLAAGNSIRLTNISFDILNPNPDLQSKELNNYSIVGTLSFKNFDVLLTGDIPANISDQLARSPEFSRRVERVEVLKVPHHGSKNGLTQGLLEKLSPKLAVINVGKNNRYGHPHSEVIRLLVNWGIRVLRTDLDGEIEVISDGEEWWIKN